MPGFFSGGVLLLVVARKLYTSKVKSFRSKVKAQALVRKVRANTPRLRVVKAKEGYWHVLFQKSRS